MDIKESIISSFFFHAILLLLMTAVAGNTTGSIEDIRNVISIELTMEDIETLSDDKTGSADAPPLVSSQPPIEEEGLPDKKENEPAAESMSEPEKSEEAVAEPAKTEDAVKPPAQTEGQTYTVQKDDWLSKIAEKEYGDVLAYPAIVHFTNLKADEDSTFARIEDPDLIEVGWTIYLPPAEEATADYLQQMAALGRAAHA